MTDQNRSLREVREAKARAWEARGFLAYGNDQGPLDSIEAIHTAHASHDNDTLQKSYGDKVYRVAGRVIASRDTGKLVFIKLRDGHGELQLFLSAKELGESFTLLKELDLGDILWAEGRPMRTRTNELSLLVTALRPLSKSMRPIPSEWFGIEDVETRYRQRYADLIANHPDVPSVFRARALITRALREWFDARDFIEVETPTLVTVHGGATARPFTTHHNTLDLDLYLRIAPELFLKRLIVGGLDRVYEIGRVWRNEGISTRHNPEFTILEFYQSFATYEVLMEETEELVVHVNDRVAERFPKFSEGRSFTLARPWKRVRMLDAVRDSIALRSPSLLSRWSVLGGSGDWTELQAAVVADGAIAHEHRDYVRKCTTAGELLFALFEVFAEPHLVEDHRTEDRSLSVPVFITDYPFDVSPLARRKDRVKQVAQYGEGFPIDLVDRFELFVEGRELANAFSELNDPADQAERFKAQVAQRAGGNEEAMQYDEDYIRALEYGMPPTAGFGLGVDRLVMLLTGRQSIRDVVLFPLLRPEG